MDIHQDDDDYFVGTTQGKHLSDASGVKRNARTAQLSSPTRQVQPSSPTQQLPLADLPMLDARHATRIGVQYAGKPAYIHVRNFTKTDSTAALHLEAFIWFVDGTCKGPYNIDQVVPRQMEKHLNKPMTRNEVYGATNLTFPLAKDIAFLQLRRRGGLIERLAHFEEDIFIHDAFLKPNNRKSPAKNIVAYFRYTGFLVHTRNILMPNLLRQNPLLVSECFIRKSKLNEKSEINDRLVPLLEWANTEKADALLYRERSAVDAAGLGYGRQLQRFLWDTLRGRNTPLIANLILSYKLDIPRYAGLTPGFVRLPPGDFTFSSLKFVEFVEKNSLPIPFAKAFARRDRLGLGFSTVDFTDFLSKHPNRTSEREKDEVRRIVDHSREDEELGRQLTEGVFCTEIHVVPDEPEPWLLDLISEANPDPKSRLFYMDYSCLVGVPRNAEAPGYFAPARCVLELRRGRLYPIAISLFYCREYYSTELMEMDILREEVPSEEEEEGEVQRRERRLSEGIWMTHLPTHATWPVARLFLKSAAGQHHQIVAHALYTHLVIEPFAVALERVVPLDHILYRILKTHFRYTLDVNFKARTALIDRGGVFDQFIATGGIHAGHMKFMEKMFKQWTVEKMFLPDELASRGFFKDPRKPQCELPEYMYAQDASDIWDAMTSYLTDIIDIAYPTEEALCRDNVQRNYFMDVQANGFPNAPYFVPGNKEQLIRVLTGIIFTATAQHAAVNFPQFAHYGYVLNSPLNHITKAPFPSKGAAINLAPYLPNEDQCLKAIATGWGLSRFVEDDERFIYDVKHDEAQRNRRKHRGHEESEEEEEEEDEEFDPDHPPKRHRHFFNLSISNDPRYRRICVEFQDAMRALETKILTRKPSVYGTRYRWLLPSMIPTSIAT